MGYCPATRIRHDTCRAACPRARWNVRASP
jgi:hypothetical protein